jgi:hypothetical protein
MNTTLENIKETWYDIPHHNIKNLEERLRSAEISIEKLFNENLKLQNKILEITNFHLNVKNSEYELRLSRERTINYYLRRNIPLPFMTTNTPLINRLLPDLLK